MLVFAYIRYCFNDTSGRESSIGTGKLSLCTGELLRRFKREIVEYHQLTMQDVACILEWGHWRGYSSLSHQGITSSKHQYANFSPVLSNSCGSPCTKNPWCFSSPYADFPSVSPLSSFIHNSSTEDLEWRSDPPWMLHVSLPNRGLYVVMLTKSVWFLWWYVICCRDFSLLGQYKKNCY